MAKHYLMAKHLLSMSGNKLYEDEVEVTFGNLYAMLLNNPDFVVLVYNDRAYHPTLVKGPTSGDNKWRVSFSSPIIDGVTTKTAEIECESSDGQVISKITTTAVNSENVSNKTDDVTANATSSTKYPSAKAVAEYVAANADKTWKGTRAQYDALKSSGQIETGRVYMVIDDDASSDSDFVVKSNQPMRFVADSTGYVKVVW